MANNHTEVKVGHIPPCDIDMEHGDAYADAKLSFGPWAYVCEGCFKRFRCKLGLGLGQRLVRR